MVLRGMLLGYPLSLNSTLGFITKHRQRAREEVLFILSSNLRQHLIAFYDSLGGLMVYAKYFTFAEDCTISEEKERCIFAKNGHSSSSHCKNTRLIGNFDGSLKFMIFSSQCHENSHFALVSARYFLSTEPFPYIIKVMQHSKVYII